MLFSKISLLHLSSFIYLPACWSPKSPPLHLSPFLLSPCKERQRFWFSACRETNEGRQMKKGDKWRRETRSGSDFGNQHAGRQMKKGDFGNEHAGRLMKGDNWRGGDFGKQHAGRQRKGDKWRGGDFGNQHAGRQMEEDEWRERNEEVVILGISMQGAKWRKTNEEGRLGAAAISVISMQGNKGRRETRGGSDFGNQHAGRQMKGDKWRRETRGGSNFGNQHAGRQTNEAGRPGAAAISVTSNPSGEKMLALSRRIDARVLGILSWDDNFFWGSHRWCLGYNYLGEIFGISWPGFQLERID